MTSTWTPLGIDSTGTVRTCFSQVYPISASGAVTSVNAGTGITVGGTATAPVVSNTGVVSLGAGSGVSIGGTSTAPVVNNTGVLSLTAGTNITLGGTAQNPVVNASGSPGVGSVNAGTNIAVTGPSTSPTVSLASPLTGPVTINGALAVGGLATLEGGLSMPATQRQSNTSCFGTLVAPVSVSTNGAADATTAATSAYRGVIQLTITTSAIAPNNEFIVRIPNLLLANTAVTKVYYLGSNNAVPFVPLFGGASVSLNEISITWKNLSSATNAPVGTVATVAWETEFFL